jgi:5-methylcytosine-specific restriction protein B
MPLDPTIAANLSALRRRRLDNGTLLPEQDLQRHYETFEARFGPPVLRRLDGAELLERMHNHSNRESLVYWLEFKDDEELPAVFGSIAGGSALKFGIYRRKETGAWMSGSPQAQFELTLDDAVVLARRNRDQLVGGAEALQRFRATGSKDYAALQREIEKVAGDVSDTAWGHKYLSMLFPDLLDDYHVVEYQRFHLIRMLERPPEGRYTAAGVFAEVAKQLQMPMNHLTSVLNERNGKPHKYYRIGTGTEEARRSQWAMMRDGACVAIGWPKLGDLAAVEKKIEGKELVRALLEKHYPGAPQTIGRGVAQVFRFVAHFEPGDVVLAADGQSILGIGRVAGPYRYVDGAVFPHQRSVEWLSLREWKLPIAEGLRTTLHEMRKYPENLIEAERLLLTPDPPLPPPPVDPTVVPGPPPPLAPLTGVPGRIQAVLDRKGQVILYGPPGTGKTYWAEATAHELAARSWFGKPRAALTDDERGKLRRAIVMCTFHAAYGYEDFLEGFRPKESGGALVFERRDGIFKRLCEEARANPTKHHFLLIDEINRGDIPRIFGELLTVLERTRRGQPISLGVSGELFSVPANVFVIGTMNTADRSIALLDAALRRRFGFVELMPDGSVLGNASVSGIPLGPWLEALNERILKAVRRDARNLQVGHTYLMHDGHPISDFGRLVQVLRDDVIPLLEEYCYEDYEALERVLGQGLVHRDRRRINEALFRAGREADLVQALLQPCPDITATPEAIASGDDQNAEPEEEDDEDAPHAAPT